MSGVRGEVKYDELFVVKKCITKKVSVFIYSFEEMYPLIT